MPVIRDPDFLDYGEYDVNAGPINPYTASKNNAGQPAQLLIDYDDRKFALTAPKYSEIGAGNTTLAGYGGTGGVTGQALYSKFKQIWKEDSTAIKYPFPMEAITPESFEFINGWEPDGGDEANTGTNLDWFATQGITTGPAITRKLLRDCGWAERTTVADGNIIKAKYFGIITLGAISRPFNETNTAREDARIYCTQFNPGIGFTFATNEISGDRIVLGDGVNNTITTPDMWTGSGVVYQQPTAENQGIGITHNRIYYLRYETTQNNAYLSGERPGGTTVGFSTNRIRFSLYNTKLAAVNADETERVSLTVGAGTSVGTFRHQSTAPNFFFNITEEGGAANEAFQFYESNGSPYRLVNNFDNFFKIYCREKGRTYADQSISQVGVTQINYQAYRIPLATSADSNLQDATGADITDGNISDEGVDAYTGIGVSFYQEPLEISINNVPYDFNCVIDANGKTLAAVYQKIQYLLRNPNNINANTVNAGFGFTSINSLSAVGGPAGTPADPVGAGTSYGNDLRYGATEDLLLEFVGTNLFAKTRDDVYTPSETTGGANSSGGNFGIFIDNVGNDDLNSVFYYDNDGVLREQPFVSSFTLVFNTNLNEDNDARFWVFFDADETIPGITTSFPTNTTAVPGTTAGIDATEDRFDVGAGAFHPFVNGQEVVAIGTASDIGIGITCETLAAGIVTFETGRSGPNYYFFNVVPSDYAGKSISSEAANPTIYVYGTDTAEFDLDALGISHANHPFYIKEGSALTPVPGTGSSITDARVVGNGATSGIVTFTPGAIEGGTSREYYYLCSSHSSMVGTIEILDKKQDSAWKYYVNAQKSAGVGQTYPDVVESGVSTTRVGVGSTSTLKLHYTYLDAVANGGVGINTINLTVSPTAGVVTFTEVDVNYQENNATVVQTSTQQPGGQIYLDNIDVPASGSFGLTYDYDFNAQRGRTEKTDASARVVAIGLQRGQFVSQGFTITRNKGQSVSVTGALERVYSDPVN